MDFVISVLNVVESSFICDIWNSSLHTIVVRLFDRREIQPTNQPMADSKKHVLSKVVKNTSFQIKTLLVMFYRHNKIFWYQLCNFKHFLKAENSEDSLASSCEEFCMGFR